MPLIYNINMIAKRYAFIVAVLTCLVVFPFMASAAPSIPGKPTFTYNSNDTITLSWSANGNPGGTQYNIYKDGSLVVPMFPGTSYNVTGFMTPGATYQFSVLAYDGSSYSDTSSSSDPFLMHFRPKSLVATTASSTQINLTWDKNGNADTIVYAVVNASTSALIATTTTNSYSNSGLLPNSDYSYAVGVINATGTADTFSASTTATTFTPTPVLVSSSFGTSTWAVVWAAGDNLAGTVYEVNCAGTISTTTSFSSSCDGLVPDTAQTFKIASLNKNGVSGLPIDLSSQTLPLAPANLSATALSSNQIGLSWESGGNTAGVTYEIYNVTTGAAAGLTTGTSYTVGGLGAGSAYQFKVRTRGSAITTVYSDYSNTASASTNANGGGGGGGGGGTPKPKPKPIAVEGSSTVAVISPIVFIIAPTSTPAGKSFYVSYQYFNLGKREILRVTREFIDPKGKVVSRATAFPTVKAFDVYKVNKVWQTVPRILKPGEYTMKVTIVGRIKYENSFKIQVGGNK